MAALTANLAVEISNGRLTSRLCDDGQTFYNGAILFWKTGKAQPFVKEASAVFAGIKHGYLKTESGATNEKEDTVWAEGRMQMIASGLTVSSVGSNAYADDDNLIYDATATNRMIVGKIVKYISATSCEVEFGPWANGLS